MDDGDRDSNTRDRPAHEPMGRVSAPGGRETRSTAESLGSRQLLNFALNWVPAVHLALIGISAYLAGRWRPVSGLLTGVLLLYLAPPLLGRLLAAAFPIRNRVVEADSREFVIWWASSCLQGLFNRFHFLEELLRIVPTVYSNWLRLWGSRIGRLAFWAPGVHVLDRAHLDIGDEVLFGAGVRIAPHIVARNADGTVVLLLDTVRIGDRVSVGGYSFLGPGTEMAPGETTRAFFISPPFSSWRNGKRTKVPVEGWQP